MKQKIFILTLCFVFITNSFVFGNEKEVLTINNHIYSNVDDEGNIYISEKGVSSEKSATAVVVGGSVASTILALATKAGITFLDTNSMDEFLYRFFALDSATEIVQELTSCIGGAVGGVINITRSLLDTIKTAYDNIFTFKDVKFINIGNATIPIVPSASVGTNQFMVKLADRTSGGIYFNSGEHETTGSKEYEIYGTKVRLEYEVLPAGDYDGSRVYIKYLNTSGQWVNAIRGDYMYQGRPDVNVYAIPYLTYVSSDTFTVSLVHKYVGDEDWKSGGSRAVGVVNVTNSSIPEKVINATVGSAWSDTIGGSSEDISIKIPSNMGQLVGQGSESVTDNPTYDTWQPGVDVTIPDVENPNIVVTPEKPDIDNPGTDTDNPGSDIPDSGGGTSWDWLSNLIQAIIGLLNNIWEWITGFWDMLTNILSSALSGIVDILTNIWNWIKEFWNTFTKTLGDILSSIFSNIFEFFESFWETLREFIIGLFVPQETYWSDKVTELNGEIKNKFPTVDIEELEDLAVGEKKFEDIYATFFGQKCLVVRASLVNEIIGWARPIIQGLICIFLLIFNYNNLYRLLRNGVLTNPSESSHKK